MGNSLAEEGAGIQWREEQDWQSRDGDPKHLTSPSQHFVISGVSKSLSSVEEPFDSVHHLILNIKLINITCSFTAICQSVKGEMVASQHILFWFTLVFYRH